MAVLCKVSEFQGYSALCASVSRPGQTPAWDPSDEGYGKRENLTFSVRGSLRRNMYYHLMHAGCMREYKLVPGNHKICGVLS
jgi:hypothetical protein